MLETETVEVGRQKKGLPLDDLGRRRRGVYDGPKIDNYDKFCESRPHALRCVTCDVIEMSIVIYYYVQRLYYATLLLYLQITIYGPSTNRFRSKSRPEVSTTTMTYSRKSERKRTRL